ncbi:adenylate/guanylate cyclase domain-containing protein [Rhizobiales bacterium]|uniref:CHASE2 domain-containing protein n=1 Tax=Hongsoonwoonella zoysiae TaxID=2821844 RepID=UPI0015601B3F|nr:adenylate/guanylate cyclase domain-containing protein [Hongsoonwoonella zoysiae]NRG17405.1 adenylate/guanylate cyclase domain-containing protein [Hongsoonwoonella zoysiae]
MGLFRRKELLVPIVAGLVLATVTGLRGFDPFFLSSVRELTFDAFQRIWPRTYESAPVVIVDIDEKSLDEFGQWPWPRDLLARLTQRLSDVGAAAIAYDIIFAEPDRNSPHRILRNLGVEENSKAGQLEAITGKLPDTDILFASAIKGRPVVVGFATLPSPGDNRPAAKAGFAYGGHDPAGLVPTFLDSLTSLPALENAAAGVGSVSLSLHDTAGVVRRLPLLFSDGEKLYPSLSVEALRIAQGASGILIRTTGASGEIDSGAPAITEIKVGAFKIPTTAAGEIWLHFDRDRGERYFSAADILDPEKEAAAASAVEGRIVLVGTSSVGLSDIRVTPLGELVPGVSVHAQALEQITTGRFLTRPDWAYGLELIVTFALGLFIISALPSLGAGWTAAFGAVSAGLIFGGAAYLFTEQSLLIDPVYPALANLLVYATATALLYLLTEREKRFVRTAFGQYLSPELVKRLENAPEGLRLGGEMREITILFMDVRGFTRISEQLSPTDLVGFLNTLLSPLSEAIQAEGGTIDKYIGDSIMAFWNAPITVEDHAARACRAGLALTKAVDRLNAKDAFGFKARGLPAQDVRIGVGINSGPACVGNMGSTRRFNYSAIGDAVNVAARIEASCKTVGADCVVSEDTMRGAPKFAYLEAGVIPLKGKTVPVKLYALAGSPEYAASSAFSTLREAHAKFISAMDGDDGKAARAYLAECRKCAPQNLSDFYDRLEERITALPRMQSAGG